METKTAKILDGKTLAAKIQKELAKTIKEIQPKISRPPGLAVLMVGNNPASATYVANKEKACHQVGIATFGRHFPTETSQNELQQIS